MRVLIVGDSSFDSVAYSCRNALEAMGHDARVFDSNKASAPWPFTRSRYGQALWALALKGTVREDRGYFQRRLLAAAGHFAPDWVLVIPITQVLPATVQKLKERFGCLVSGWFQDSMVNFGRADFFLADYDVLCFQDRWVVERLSAWTGDQRIAYLPQCCDPALHRPVDLSESDRRRFACQLATYGNLYPYRARILQSLLGFDLRIYGALQGWERSALRDRYAGYPVFGLEKSKAMRAAGVVVNTNHYSEVAGVNKRTYEVAGMGAFQLTDAPGLSEVFAEDEVAPYCGPRELVEKAAHYLAHPEARCTMAQKAQRRAHAEHTYSHRMRQIISLCPGLSARE